jgi:hypothetical protein
MQIVKEVLSLGDCRVFARERGLLVLRQVGEMRQLYHTCISTTVEVYRVIEHTMQPLEAPRGLVTLWSQMRLHQ